MGGRPRVLVEEKGTSDVSGAGVVKWGACPLDAEWEER